MKPVRAFVVGTDTGVGKTQVAAALLSLLADRGDRPAPFKPYETGVIRGRPLDALALKEAARSDDALDVICPHQFREPLAPAIAGRRIRKQPSFEKTLAAFRFFENRSLIVEAAGGLRVPIDDQHDILDLVVELGLPAILVARSGLGTLNHTALSLDALESRGVRVLAVVLSRGPVRDPSERDNPAFIAGRHRVAVLGPVPFLRDDARRRAAFRRVLRPLVE